MASFFDLDLKSHLGVDTQLMKLSKLLDWNRFRKLLEGVHSEQGPTGYDVVQMFKCLLLQNWHSLSDPKLEESLRVRLDFLQFTEFRVGDKLPDETTFCRFRNKLVAKGMFESLLQEVNKQLEAHGLKVKQASVAIVDATIISSGARPRKVIEVSEDNEVLIEHSADSDARWKVKGKRSYFGYQGFARSDSEGFIDKTHVTSANEAETNHLDCMTDGLAKGTRVKTDKGFFSAANKAMLKDKRLKNGLMYKAFSNTPLSEHKKRFNKLISKLRFRIEQCFGTLKRRFNFARASYFGVEKVAAQFIMKAMCLNLLKGVNKVKIG